MGAFRFYRRARIPGLSVNDEQPERHPIPRAWREEFDGVRPIKPITYKKPTPREAQRPGVK